ncbi:MAG: hypothetical protein HY270_12005 [Deltaproteobacteria bacterium]|nr:hypothetical protein [Deltaproteobacteria bacterium]
MNSRPGWNSAGCGGRGLGEHGRRPTGKRHIAAPAAPPAYTRPRHYAWADLLQRTFSIDILECPECGGRLRFLATIETRAIVEKILRHLSLPVEAPQPAPARVAGWLPGVDATEDWITE